MKNIHKDKWLEGHIGCYVELLLFDGTEICGTLEHDDIKGKYLVTGNNYDYAFYKTHIKKILDYE